MIAKSGFLALLLAASGALGQTPPPGDEPLAQLAWLDCVQQTLTRGHGSPERRAAPRPLRTVATPHEAVA